MEELISNLVKDQEMVVTEEVKVVKVAKAVKVEEVVMPNYNLQ